jgi:hypothetical protein
MAMSLSALTMLLLATPALVPGMSSLAGTPPLRIVSVVRPGLPPYEDENRLYRIEGEGCARMHQGEPIVLQRKGEQRDLGRLKVVGAYGGYALAQVVIAGETFPLKGDLVYAVEGPRPLPSMVASKPAELASGAALGALPVHPLSEPAPPTSAHPSPQRQGQQQPIYFLKGDARLSPGALVKLKRWVDEWGTEGAWIVGYPDEANAEITQTRAQALRAELIRLGAASIQLKVVREAPKGRYDALLIAWEPR